jgi:integrase/recombinase XerD
MVMLVVRLGLRASEVAAIELDDLDWRAGELTVRGKAGRRDLLPVPADVGGAIAAYLQRRGPGRGTRQVFVHVKPTPRPGATMTDVRAAVRRACWRAGLIDTGTHRFRYRVATDMLAAGAPLYEIGQVLRHRDVETTSLYAKVDFGALVAVAQPWPGGPS